MTGVATKNAHQLAPSTDHESVNITASSVFCKNFALMLIITTLELPIYSSYMILILFPNGLGKESGNSAKIIVQRLIQQGGTHF
jgi:hypothetical protein